MSNPKPTKNSDPLTGQRSVNEGEKASPPDRKDASGDPIHGGVTNPDVNLALISLLRNQQNKLPSDDPSQTHDEQNSNFDERMIYQKYITNPLFFNLYQQFSPTIENIIAADIATSEQIEKIITESVKSTVEKIRVIQSWNPFKFDKAMSDNIPVNELTNGLIKGANALNQWMYQAKIDPSKERELHCKAANLSCKMLKTVLRNKDFQSKIRHLANKREEYQAELIEMVTNFKKLEEFFDAEQKLLEDYGLPDAEIYVNEGRKALAEVLEGQAPHTNIYTALDDLSRAACRLSSDLNSRTREINSQQRTRILKKVITGVGGTIIILVNVQAANELGGSVTELSSAMGNAVISAATGNIWDQF